MVRASKRKAAAAAAKTDIGEADERRDVVMKDGVGSGSDIDQPPPKKGTAGKNVIDVTEIDDAVNGGVRVESSADSVGSNNSESGNDNGTTAGGGEEKEEKPSENEIVMSAAFGSDQAILDEKDEDSNLADVEPEVGMAIDFRDPDYIWSSGKIVAVKSTKSKAGKKQVTVQYDGWPPDWNEVVSWPSVRIARLFTYTKRVRCFVDGILPKKVPPKKKAAGDPGRKAVTCHLWPCMVRFRMPHPAHKGRAEELLRLEPNVFVQPYAPDTLPNDIVCTIENGGVWLHNNRLRMWKNENALPMLGTVHPSFEFAYKVGLNDTTTPGKLPSRAMEVGSLLNADYRVFKVGGETVKGKMFTGECPDPKPIAPKFASSKKSSSKALSDRKLRSEEAKLKAEAQAKKRRLIQRPPKLPPPLIVYDPSFKLSSEAVRLHETKRWGAAVSVGGNDLFLGSFPTQSHAIASSAIALAKDAGNASDIDDDSGAKPHARFDVVEESSPAFPKDEMEGRIADLNATRLEDSICALEKNNMHGTFGSFSLHDWTMQSIRYQTYLRQNRERSHVPSTSAFANTASIAEGSIPNESTTGNAEDADETPNKRQKMLYTSTNVDVAQSQQQQQALAAKPKSKRKQSNPRRLNLDTYVYDPPGT